MALLLKNDALFLHVPKTGGTWVTGVLEELGLVRCRVSTKHSDMERVVHGGRHFPLRHLEKLARFGPGWSGRLRRAYKFCFVRHPLTWYESWWKYMTNRGWHPWSTWKGRRQWHPIADLDGLGSPDFGTFVRNVCERQPGFVTRLYESYAPDGIDFVGKMETLADDLGRVLAAIGAPHDPGALGRRPRANVSPEAARPVVWDAALRREVERLERGALERFRYS